MIPDEDAGLLAAARAIAAGQRVDWAAIESSAAISESFAVVLRELKVVAEIAELHRSLPDPVTSPSAVSDGDASRSLNAATAAAIPETASWGSLRLLERVGQGAFGDVYRAWDPRLDREVALKLLRRLESRRDSVGSAVIDEGRLLARVRHPNVVTVYGADRIDGRVGLWMEFVRGRTLEVVLRDHGPFGAQEATLIGLDLCRALSAVHRAGLIHRDIKAQNVVREAGGRIVLMDFGTGREDLADRPAELAGTPLYLAPEVFGGAPATARSDIYSVGVLLYHLVTGSYPVKGRTVADIREAHAQQRRSWLRDDRPDLPDRFVQTVERALEFDPDLRYESAGAMEAALARVVSASESAASTPAVEMPPSPPTAEKAAGRWFARPAWMAGAALAIAVAVALVPTTWRDRMLGRHGGSPPGQGGGAGMPAGSSVVVRKVTLPEQSMLIGGPSADGKLFSLVDITGNIAVIDLATGQLRRVTTDAVLEKASQYAEFSAISADSQFIAYTWYALDGKYELRVVDVDGKRPRVLLRSDSIDYPQPLQWSHDGTSILTTLARHDRSVQLALVSVKDGTVRGVKEMGTAPPLNASVSPDGELIVYDAPQQPSASVRDVFIVRSDGSEDRRLIEHPANDVSPVWTPDGRRVLFASDRSGTMDVWGVAVDRGFAQGEPQVIHRNVGRMRLQGLTDTGSYFYYLTVGAVDVYEADLAGGTVRNPATLPTSYSGSNISSVWSPDGRRLAYASRRGLIGFDSGSTTLAVRDLQTQKQREFIPAMNSFLVRSWSPDGRLVAVDGMDPAGRQGTYAIDTNDGRVTPILIGDQIGRPDYLSDGRVLYLDRAKDALLARNVQTGAEQVLVDLRAEGIEITANVAGRGFRLSPDGQMLAYSAAIREGERWTRWLAVKVLGGGPTRELVRTSGSEMLLFQDWTADGAAVIFTRWIAKPNEPFSLWRVSIHGGDPQSLGLTMDGLRDVSVNPDGMKITFTAGWPQNELWVMENFLTNK